MMYLYLQAEIDEVDYITTGVESYNSYSQK